MPRKRILYLTIPGLMVAGIASYLLVSSSSGKEQPPEDPRITPPLVAVTKARVPATGLRSFSGVISARVQSNLGFRVQGKIVERLVDAGQRVRAGQPLMRIDPNDLQLALTARRNAVVAARADAVQAREDEARYRQLVDQGWITQQRYQQAKAIAEAADAKLAAAQAEAQVAENETGYAVLIADADGTIVSTLGEPGQVVSAGQTVIRLAHAGQREASVNLPEALRPAIGSSAQASIYGMDGQQWDARLRQLSDAADPETRTYEARYVLDGKAADAPLGATVTVSIADRTIGDTTEIPVGAVLDNGRETGVWVVDGQNSTLSLKPVVLQQIAQETALVSGLEPGDTIVAFGAHLVHDGQEVRPRAVTEFN